VSLPRPILRHGYADLLRPLLFRSYGGDPERIHEAMISALAAASEVPGASPLLGLLSGTTGSPVTVGGLRFPGRVGLAAGMDKDGVAALAWSRLGFGFAELGTVTAKAQPGNTKPRVFRARRSGALVNRMGFNNNGAEALAATLEGKGIIRGNRRAGIPLGVSLGKTKLVAVEDAIPDYLSSLRAVASHADYIAVNVSSPNTPGLRSLQDGGALEALLDSLVKESRRIDPTAPLPLWVKIAPDLTAGQLDEVVGAAEESGATGIIATNTTLGRAGLRDGDRTLASEAGGLSGRPLHRRAVEVVSYVTARTTLPVMGVGGIMTVDDAARMFDAGVSLVQLYTGFIYAGPALVADINLLTRSFA
jgi:dihydroorotate dehydrogenase